MATAVLLLVYENVPVLFVVGGVIVKFASLDNFGPTVKVPKVGAGLGEVTVSVAVVLPAL